jgi:hypothetical protein
LPPYVLALSAANAYISDVHTVIETAAFRRSAKAEGMTENEVLAAINLIAHDPLAGDLIVGSGGCRKVRVAGKGRGKSGGYRIVTYYARKDVPVFLIAVLSKGYVGNFTDAQVNAMAKVTATLVDGLAGAVR